MKEPTDTPTSGDVNIVIDESYTLLFDTEIHTFQSLYVNAKVHARYLPEDDALKALMSDSAKVAVMNRPLKEEEKKKELERKIAEEAMSHLQTLQKWKEDFLTLKEYKVIKFGKVF